MSDTRVPILDGYDALRKADQIIANAKGDQIALRYEIAQALVQAEISGADELYARLRLQHAEAES